jgi:hypothetical protein
MEGELLGLPLIGGLRFKVINSNEAWKTMIALLTNGHRKKI